MGSQVSLYPTMYAPVFHRASWPTVQPWGQTRGWDLLSSLSGVIKGVNGTELLPAFLRQAVVQGFDSKALFRSPCRYFLPRNQINVKVEGQHKKNTRVRFHVPMWQWVKTFLIQAPIKPNWLFPSHHSDILKEENYSFPFSLVTYIQTKIYF